MHTIKDFDPFGLRPEIMLALLAVQDVEHAHGLEVYITYYRGGEHSEGSLHYGGSGIDVDEINDKNKLLANKVRERLPDCYDVVNEGSHVHIEYQPKEPVCS